MTATDDQEARLRLMESSIVRIEAAVEKVAEAVQIMARLEAQNMLTQDAIKRAQAEIDEVRRRSESKQEDFDVRVRAMEVSMPQLKEGRGWVAQAAGIVLGAVLAAVVGMVVIKSSAPVAVAPVAAPSR